MLAQGRSARPHRARPPHAAPADWQLLNVVHERGDLLGKNLERAFEGKRGPRFSCHFLQLFRGRRQGRAWEDDAGDLTHDRDLGERRRIVPIVDREGQSPLSFQS
jgi:hypothetical protein